MGKRHVRGKGKRIKAKTGEESRYYTRAQALKRLQVSLKDFRRLCILRGVHPREPRCVALLFARRGPSPAPSLPRAPRPRDSPPRAQMQAKVRRDHQDVLPGQGHQVPGAARAAARGVPRPAQAPRVRWPSRRAEGAPAAAGGRRGCPGPRRGRRRRRRLRLRLYAPSAGPSLAIARPLLSHARGRRKQQD